ncbi:MAG: type I DNA topoisomerase [Thermoanaerobaculia bacterium]|nr:type I DNA topoisomerase [Thermoanaerobaculia bacterium]
MSKSLIIVESPAKTRTLKKFLGKGYAVEASVGHIRDLEKKDLGLGDNYEPRYRVLPEKREVVRKLRKAARSADEVLLAPDPDREGEAIAWHIAQVIGKDAAAIRRVTFNEITRPAVLEALEHPGEIDYRKVEAQQARRVLDRLMGFKLSPLLWKKVKQGLSAGRVQSVALKMVCEREAEIEAFEPVEYWVVTADLAAGEPPPFTARLHRIDGKKAEVGDGEQAAEIVAVLEREPYRVADVERRESKQRPAPPFITSRLQQQAARRFGFSVKKTMTLAQRLYEGRDIGDRGTTGLITYMRTDSTRVSEEALAAARAVVEKSYGRENLPPKPIRYRSKKGAQDAHEAIRPTTFDLPPEAAARYLERDELKLYTLIWERFIASQMVPALFDVTRVDVACGPYTLRAEGKILKKPGFLAVYQSDPADAGGALGSADTLLPPLAKGAELTLKSVASEQKFTKPPARYSEATLVKALEENGIGRPSTYAQILATLSDRSYVDRIEKRFHPTLLGRLVNDLLQQGFHDILNEGYTASLETELDRIEEGELDWRSALAEFDRKFVRDLELAAESLPDVKREGVPTDESCPECSSPLVLRFGRYGSFYGCSNYPECKYTRDSEDPAGGETPETPDEEIAPCEKCGRPMAVRRSRYGSFLGCTGYPECRNIRKTGPQAAEPKDTGVGCPECGAGRIQEKRSRRGKIFYSCSRYPECKYALWNPPVDRPCPSCDSKLLVQKSSKKKGVFLACPEKECDFEEPLEGSGDA